MIPPHVEGCSIEEKKELCEKSRQYKSSVKGHGLYGDEDKIQPFQERIREMRYK